jgi:hypothetical protein
MKKLSLLSSCQQMLYKSSLITALTAISLACTSLVFHPQAKAQNLPSSTELKNYADTLLKMEPLRQEAFEEIKRMIPNRRGAVPKIVCNDRNSITGLPNQARTIAVNFCQRYQRIVGENNMTIDRFNQITEIIQTNEELKEGIYDILLDMQND